MKKVFFIAFSMLIAFAIHAKDPVILESGSLTELSNPDNNVSFKIDYSKVKVNNDGNEYTIDCYLEHRGPDFVADWKRDSSKAYSYIPARFNQKNKKGAHALEMGGEKADIFGTIYLSDIDFGNGAGSFNPFGGVKSGGCIISGTLIFTDKNGDELAVLPFTEVKGIGHVSETIRLGLSYFELMNKLGDLIKKENKKK